MHSRRFGATAAAAIVATMLVGCQGAAPAKKANAPTAPTAPSAPSAPSVPLAAAWNLPGVHAISTPQASGHHIVFLATGVKGAINVVSVDAKTGKIAWQAPVTPSDVTPGESLSVLVDGDRVYYMAPHDGYKDKLGHVVAANTATGRKAWMSDYDGYYGQSIDFWDEGHALLCLSGTADTGFIASINTTTGEAHTALEVKGPSLRGLGADIYDTGERTPDMLMSFKGGKQAWVRKASDAFGGATVSSDGGWSFSQADGGPLVGSLGRPVVRAEMGKGEPRQVFDGVTAGINPQTGANLWKVEGSWLSCNGDMTGNDTETPYLCMGKGTATWDLKTAKATYQNLDLALAGFDVKTGKVTWRAPLGAAESLINTEKAKLVWLGPTEFVVPDAAGGPAAVNVTTGKTHKVRPAEAGWCSAQNTYKSAWTYSYGKDKLDMRPGDSLYYPCSVDGKKLTTVTYTIPGTGAKTDGLFVWAAPDGLHAVKLPGQPSL